MTSLPDPRKKGKVKRKRKIKGKSKRKEENQEKKKGGKKGTGNGLLISLRDSRRQQGGSKQTAGTDT